MTAFSEAAAAIRARFDANWSATSKYWENAPFEPAAGTPFVYFEVLPAVSQQISLGEVGSRLYRHVGIIYASVHVPVNTGSGAALTYADQIAAIFRGTEFSGVLCKAPDIRAGSISADGNWWRTVVAIEFQYDKTF